MAELLARLHVCITCRAGREPVDGEPVPGARLHAALDALLRAENGEAPFRLDSVSCLANCERGCSAAISMPGKWTNLLGHLDAGLAADLLAYGRIYAGSTTGTVMPSKRPGSLKNMILGRVPGAEVSA